MDVVVLALRVLLSLGVVLALLFVLHRKISKVNGTRAGAGLVSVVARQGIAAKASVVVVDAEGTRFYLGVTEQSVSVLHSAAAPRALQAVSEPDDAVVPARVLAPQPGDAAFAASLRLATAVPSTAVPSPAVPSTAVPTTAVPTTAVPTTALPTTVLNPEPGTRRAARAARSTRTSARTETRPHATPLQGSILSPATWKQTAAFLRQGRAG